MKGLSNFLPSFTRIAISLLCTLCITSNVLAQDKTATVNVKDVTVKELLKAIEAGSTYTFAYVDTDIDLTKKVTISATDKDIETIIKEVLPGVNSKTRRFFSATSPRLPDNPRRRLRSRKLHGQLQEESLTKTGSR